MFLILFFLNHLNDDKQIDRGMAYACCFLNHLNDDKPYLNSQTGQAYFLNHLNDDKRVAVVGGIIEMDP